MGGINVVILLITFCLESNLLIKKETVKVVVYENIELIQTNRQEELIADIKNRTGLDVHRISIQKIDFLKDSAQIKVYYYE